MSWLDNKPSWGIAQVNISRTLYFGHSPFALVDMPENMVLWLNLANYLS